jgi:hypothetical protein
MESGRLPSVRDRDRPPSNDVATDRSVTPAHATSACKSMSPEHASAPEPPLAACKPASTRARPVVTEHAIS